jgi:serine/threonine protein kinase
MDQDGHIGLGDFGISKQLGNEGHTKSLLGTPEYIAPEILNLEEYGMPADWWSYGSLMFLSIFFLHL